MTGATDTTEHVHDWQATGVSVSAIERELSALWRPEVGGGGDDRAIAMRTSALNLVVYTESAAAAELAAETISRLAGSHPSRAIIVEAEPHHETSSLDASLSAHCHLAATGQGKFCCEQVTITVKGEAAEHVGGVVAPLLLPDLPTVVWWQGEPPLASRAFQRLTEVADRLIIDSEAFGGGAGAWQAVRELQSALGDNRELVDLAWARLAPWRETIALAFDDPHHRPLAYGLHNLTVTVSGPAAPDAPDAVGLLASWLATATGQAPTVLVQADPSAEGRAGDLLALTLDAAAGEHTLRLRLWRAGNSTALEHQVTLDGVAGAQRRALLAPADDALLLARELESYGRDALYEAALAAM